MFKIGETVFVLVSGQDDTRQLQHARVYRADGDQIVLELDRSRGMTVGTTLMLHFNQERRFMRQPAVVTELLGTDLVPLVAVRTTAEPVDANHRAAFRVSVAAVADVITMTIAGDKRWKVTNLSAIGFGAVSRVRLQLGQTVTATLSGLEQAVTGQVRVRSIRQDESGAFHYGMQIIESPGNPMIRGLSLLSNAMQRHLLQRRALV